MPLPAADAAQVTLGWDPPAGSVAGYKIYYGNTSGIYEHSVDLGNYESCTISGLAEGTTYYFAATSYNADNIESRFSAELIYTISGSETSLPPSGADEAKIWIEAEDGDINYPFDYGWDGEASSDGFMWVPNGRGSSWDPNQKTGYIAYNFEVPDSGGYVIWGRIKAINGEDDSFYVAIDDSAYALWDTKQSQSWLWDQVKSRDSANLLVYYLEAGEHTLTIKQREDGTKIDKILVTNGLEYVPEGAGENPDDTGKEPNEPPANTDPAGLKLWLEAENAKLNYPFESAADSKASAGQFVWVPNGGGNSWDPDRNSGYIEHSFNVPAAGDYVVWGLVRARNGSDDSFYVAVDDGAYALWNTKRSRSWTWDQICSRETDPVVYHLEAGDHTLIIKQREDGTKLDKILITGDLTYTPE
jgi:hypothetical protein